MRVQNYWKQNNEKNFLTLILLMNIKRSFKNSEDIEELENINFN